jgi:hypothetical protein
MTEKLIPIALLTIDEATKLPYLKFIKPFNFNPKHLQKNVFLYMKDSNDNK